MSASESPHVIISKRVDGDHDVDGNHGWQANSANSPLEFEITIKERKQLQARQIVVSITDMSDGSGATAGSYKLRKSCLEHMSGKLIYNQQLPSSTFSKRNSCCS